MTVTNTPTPTPTATPVPPRAAVKPFRGGDWLIENNPDLADSIGALGWVADGVDDSERYALEWMLEMAKLHETTARALLSVAWVADGLSDDELTALYRFLYISRERADIAETLLSMRWVADGVSDGDLETAHRLSDISRTDADAAARVADMQFLQTLERSDITALGSLSRLSANQLADMLSHPLLKGGITDREAPTASLRRSSGGRWSCRSPERWSLPSSALVRARRGAWTCSKTPSEKRRA